MWEGCTFKSPYPSDPSWNSLTLTHLWARRKLHWATEVWLLSFKWNSDLSSLTGHWWEQRRESSCTEWSAGITITSGKTIQDACTIDAVITAKDRWPSLFYYSFCQMCLSSVWFHCQVSLVRGRSSFSTGRQPEKGSHSAFTWAETVQNTLLTTPQRAETQQILVFL